VKAQLTEVEQQISHMLTAIKSGFRSERRRQDLEAAEAERTRLQAGLTHDVKQLEKVTSFLPNMAERFKDMVEGLPP
jgi:hypothetical protein